MGSVGTSKGGRKRTGTVEEHGTHADGSPRFRFRVRLGDGTKSERFDVPHGLNEAQARAFVASMQAQEDAHGLLLAKKRDARRAAGAPADDGTMDAWFTDWIASKKARGQTTTGDREAHYRLHVRPVLGSKHVRDWTAEDLRAVVASLDGKIASQDLSARSARNIWGTVTKACGDAMRSKLDALRVRSDNPAKTVEGPDRGENKTKQFLYPNEFLQLMACDEIPLRWRRAVALAIYMFPRAGELRALRWDDVDLEHGSVHIHRAFERRSRTIKSTKTKTARRFAVEPTALALLQAMHDEADRGELVCPIPGRMADRLRGWLRIAGVTRMELHDETSRTTKPLGFHDLRATGLTWMAVRGDDPLKIMQRAGHEDFATTQIYIRTAEAVRVGFGEPFPPLPSSLFPPFGPTFGPTVVQPLGIAERDTGFEAERTMLSAPRLGVSEGTANPKMGDTSIQTPETGGIGPAIGPAPTLDDALTSALLLATQRGDLEIVARIVGELEARRRAASPNVVTLAPGARVARPSKPKG